MAIELRQQLKLAQQLVMTPQLQMAIRLLQLSRVELLDTIRQELEENPTLEDTQDIPEESSASEHSENDAGQKESVEEVAFEDKIPDDVDWSNYLDDFGSAGKTTFEFERKETTSFEAFLTRKESLQDHLLWQLMMSFPSEEEKGIGSLIIGNLNADGYLDITVEEIAEQAEASLEQCQALLTVMQTFDPVGVCSRDLRECLLIQARHLGIDNTIVIDIINRHLLHLQNRNIKALCRALKVKREEVIAAVEIIQGLEPKPGRQFSEEIPQHIIPDIYVYKLEDEFIILLNENGLPRLRVSQLYKKNITQSERMTSEEREYVQEKMRSATWLIRSIHQRQKTIYRVMESILKFQRDFFDKGVAHLKPMVLRDVAQDIEMHESTISRVTTNKYVHTPRGIFELKYFFNSSINRVEGDAIASESVKDKIRQIISSEDGRKPYSDNKIAALLKASNINIARRTVAKYREMLNVLPSSKRKQF
jgi:RNA polymerase sigma-54 factor